MNAIIFHGTGPHASYDKFWYRPLAQSLTEAGIDADVPELAQLDREPLDDTLKEFDALNIPIDENTVLIGHSAGVSFILALLERLHSPVKACYMIAGYCSPNGMKHAALKDSYAWDDIKANAGECYIFNSFNDPFKCNQDKGIELFNHVGGTLLLRNDGHFLQKQQPLLLKLILP
ncbi:alpha/beta hydrolase [Bifidobacterium aquikefiricola]|uniref:Alpha/beta hydrolase n=1 Tax=Bifidobacterium aquikefiricola TaxID=3059038 RepID=A0AB39U4I9_9BIFI